MDSVGSCPAGGGSRFQPGAGLVPSPRDPELGWPERDCPVLDPPLKECRGGVAAGPRG